MSNQKANEYSCPECGSEVYAWVEEVVEHRSKINPKTGAFKRILQVSIGDHTNNAGVHCTECDWSTYHGDDSIPGKFIDGVMGERFGLIVDSANSRIK